MLRAEEGIDHRIFDAMGQLAGFAFGRDEVVPATGGGPGRLEVEDAVGQGVAEVVVEKEPAVEVFLAESGLNGGEVFHFI